MESKYPSLSTYGYVGGNPVRFVDITGMDSTVYVYFDPASEHFNGEKGNANRKKLISSMQAIYDANGVPVHIVITSLTPNDITNNSSFLDKTDQYVAFSAGMIDFDDRTEKGFTDNQFSFVNLLQNSFGGDALVKSENGPEIGLIANTAVHETIHGYLKRAGKYFGETNKRMGLDSEGHADTSKI